MLERWPLGYTFLRVVVSHVGWPCFRSEGLWTSPVGFRLGRRPRIVGGGGSEVAAGLRCGDVGEVRPWIMWYVGALSVAVHRRGGVERSLISLRRVGKKWS
jgi:hypothetical protein